MFHDFDKEQLCCDQHKFYSEKETKSGSVIYFVPFCYIFYTDVKLTVYIMVHNYHMLYYQ